MLQDVQSSVSVGSVDPDSLYDEAHEDKKESAFIYASQFLIVDVECWHLDSLPIKYQMNDRMMDHMVNRMIDVETL